MVSLLWDFHGSGTEALAPYQAIEYHLISLSRKQEASPLCIFRSTSDTLKGYHPLVFWRISSWGKGSQRAINCKVAS